MKSERVIYAGANPQSQDQDQGSDAMKAEILKKTKEEKYTKEERKRKRFVDNNEGNPSHGGEPAMDAGDWRSQLQADSRQRIINKIMETLLNHIPFSGQEGMTEIKKIAARFEEKMYGAAKSQSDYLRKISLKMLTWESKYKSTNTNSLQLNSAGSSGMQPQVTIQGQHLSENIQSNISSAEVQNTDGLSSALPPTFVSGISSAQAPTPALNMSSLQSALPTLPGAYMPDSLSALPSPQGSSCELFPFHGVTRSDSSAALPSSWSLNLLAKYPWKMQGWQQAVPLQPQQQSENLQQRIYQEQLKQQLLQSHIPLLQKQQQEMLQKPPLLSSQQSHVQLASSAVQIALSRFQQHEQSAISNLTESMVQQAAIPQEQILFTHQQQGQLPSPHMPSMEHSQTQFAQVQSPMNQMNPQQQHLGSQTASLDSTAHTGHTNGADWEEEVCQKVSMDTNNWRPPPGGEPAMDTGDWRSQLQADSRQRIVNKITDTLKRHLPFSGQEGLHELKKIAVRFEEKIYTAATSQSDYLRKISLKMLTMESKSQNTMGNSSLPSNSGGNSNRLPDPGSFGMEAESPNQGQSLSMPVLANQSQTRQQLLSQNIQNNITLAGVQNSAGLSSALPPASGLTQNPIPSLVGQSANLQSMSGTSQNSLGNSMGQGVASNMFANTQRPIPGRQQVVPQQQQQQPQISLQYMYQQQLQQQPAKSNFKPGNLQLMQNLMQQQQLQQNLLQQQNNMTGLQNMMNSLQASSNADPRQGTALNSLQQFPVGSIQQNPLSAPPQANMNSFSSQNGINVLQNNINLLKSNSGIFPSQHLKQQEQQLYQNQLKQQYQQRQMQKHQIFQQQGLLQQLPGQMETRRHQINIVDDMNINAFSSSQGGSNMLQGSIDSLLSSSGVVYNQCQKQKQEEEVFQNQLKQPYVQVQMQKPQMLQEKQRRQIQQLQQQAKQQLHHIYFIYLIFLAILMGAYFFGTSY